MTKEKDDIDDMLASLGLGPEPAKPAAKEEPKVEEKPAAKEEPKTENKQDILDELDILSDIIEESAEKDVPLVLDDTIIEELIEETGEVIDPMPEPVKPAKRGRPAKAKTAPKTKSAAKAEPEITEAVEEISENVVIDNPTQTPHTEVKSDSLGEERTIYIANDNQIINGHIYSRGQKITYRVGDKFYHSQTDRHGRNWLDLVSDYDAQYAYFGRIIAESGQWSGIPFGSLEGIDHPGLAAAIRKVAMEELERNGTPFN